MQQTHCPPDPAVFATPGAFCALALAVVPGFEDTLDENTTGVAGDEDKIKAHEYVLTLNADALGHTLTSVTSYMSMDFSLQVDAGGVDLPVPLLPFLVAEEFQQWSQES